MTTVEPFGGDVEATMAGVQNVLLPIVATALKVLTLSDEDMMKAIAAAPEPFEHLLASYLSGAEALATLSGHVADAARRIGQIKNETAGLQ